MATLTTAPRFRSPPPASRTSRRRGGALTCEHLESRCLMAYGDLDTTFGVAGVADTPLFVARSSLDRVADIAAQADGNVVSVGSVSIGSSRVVGMSRHRADGTLDTTFGDEGIVLEPMNSFGSGSGGSSVSIQSDGKIVVAGSGRFGEVFVARYLADGQRDASFGSSGVAFFQTSGGLEVLETVLRADGGILLVGQAATGVANGYATYDAVLVQFDSGGQLDANFGQGGVVFTSATDFRDTATDVAIQADGKIVVSGTSSAQDGSRSLFVARYFADGTPDGGFGNGDIPGVVRIENFGRTPPSSESANVGLVVQSSGRLVLAATRQTGSGIADFALIGIRSDGLLDSSFGEPGSFGIQVTPIPGMPDASARDLTLAPDGRILAVGASTSATQGLVVRYSASGVLDTSWGVDGVAASPMLYEARRVLARGDGAPIVACVGFVGPAPLQPDFGLARLTLQGSLDPAFGDTGVARLNFLTGNSSAAAAKVVVQGDGKLIQAGACDGPTGAAWCITRLDAAGTLDSTYGNGGIVRVGVEVGDAGPLPLLAPDGRLLVVGNSWSGGHLRILVARLTADGTPDTSWGQQGNVFVEVNASYVYAAAAQLQPNGALVIEGLADYGSGLETRLYRVSPSGSLDATFGAAGTVQLDPPAHSPLTAPLLLQSDGRIVAATNRIVAGVREVAVRRYLPSGQIDTSWGAGGLTAAAIGTIDQMAQCGAATFMADGHIMIGCHVATGNLLIRLDSDGHWDSNFGVDGLLAFPAEGQSSADLVALTALPSGDVAAIGWDNSTVDAGAMSTLVQFFKPDGSRNQSAGNTGVLRLDQPDSSNLSAGGSLSPDGRLIVTGRWENGIDVNFLAARVEGDGATYRPWRHASHPLDVDADPAHAVASIDALIVVNDLNQWGARALAPLATGVQPYAYPDVDGDNYLAPLDALLVINALNGLTAGEGEGQAGLSGESSAELVGPADGESAGAGDLAHADRDALFAGTLWLDAELTRPFGSASESQGRGRVLSEGRDLIAQHFAGAPTQTKLDPATTSGTRKASRPVTALWSVLREFSPF